MMDDKEFEAIASSFNEEFMRAVSALVRLDGLLSLIRHRSVSHMAGGRAANVHGGLREPSGETLVPIEANMQMPFDELEAGDADKLIAAHVAGAKEIKSEMTRRAFERMDEIAEQEGMMIDARERPFSADLFVEMLEKLDLRFDESGDVIMPSVVLHPSVMAKFAAVVDTEEAREKIAAVIERKKKAKRL